MDAIDQKNIREIRELTGVFFSKNEVIDIIKRNSHLRDMKVMDLAAKYAADTTILEKFDRFMSNNPHIGNDHPALGLQAGDVVTFISGHDNDQVYKARLLGVTQDGMGYMQWDAYWSPVDLNKYML
jgi:hypothetical protein